MQETRRQILQIIRERGEATVDDIVCDLESRRGAITAVTVRHHLTKLQQDGLVDTPQMRHRSAPGRPQHIYVLTSRGVSFFPNNYQHMTEVILNTLENHLAQSQINVIIEGVSDAMAQEAFLGGRNIFERLQDVIGYLSEHGYEASWEHHPQGYVLNLGNCPYHNVAASHDILCQIDMRLIAKMLGIVPRLLTSRKSGEESCSYLIPASAN